MGWYAEHVLPRCIDRALRGEEHAEVRERSLAPARGRVLEIGFGSGLNLPHYRHDPAGESGVSELLAIDPATLGRKLARARLAATSLPVRVLDLGAHDRLPLDDAAVDEVVSTWTLCTVADADATLAELRRVLVPGGVLRFVEHGRSRDERIARWQRRLTPIQAFVGGGCRLDRPIDALVRGAGFALDALSEYELEGPRVYTYTYEGVARAPRAAAAT